MAEQTKTRLRRTLPNGRRQSHGDQRHAGNLHERQTKERANRDVGSPFMIAISRRKSALFEYRTYRIPSSPIVNILCLKWIRRLASISV